MVESLIEIINVYDASKFEDYVRGFYQKSISDKLLVIKVTIFFAADGNPDYFEKSANIQSSFQKVIKELRQQMPCLSFIAQPPLEAEFVLEAYTIPISKQHQTVTFKSYNANNYVTIENQFSKWIFTSPIQPQKQQAVWDITDLIEHIDYSFDVTEEILQSEGFNLGNIVRQWAYIEKVLNEQVHDGGLKQYYQVFSDIRTKHYEKYQFPHSYPAATGVGTEWGLFHLEVICLKLKSDYSIRVIPISNPNQVNAYEYSQKRLVGSPLAPFKEMTTPKFERGKAVMIDNKTCFYISGTSSVKGEDSVFVDDVLKQTKLTFENLVILFQTFNSLLQAHESQITTVDMDNLRVYIRKADNFKTIRAICSAAFPHTKVIYLNTAICRNDLSLEIEGVVFKELF